VSPSRGSAKTDRSGHLYSLLDRKFRAFHALGGGLQRCTLKISGPFPPPVNIQSVPSSCIGSARVARCSWKSWSGGLHQVLEVSGVGFGAVLCGGGGVPRARPRRPAPPRRHQGACLIWAKNSQPGSLGASSRV
jgi:hypothetical protein